MFFIYEVVSIKLPVKFETIKNACPLILNKENYLFCLRTSKPNGIIATRTMIHQGNDVSFSTGFSIFGGFDSSSEGFSKWF